MRSLTDRMELMPVSETIDLKIEYQKAWARLKRVMSDQPILHEDQYFAREQQAWDELCTIRNQCLELGIIES